ncbi:helix-turn-helix domain-containing protein [uncultured Microbacterium sp.]|uniref:helix-turn-helix domain-containing protein n=1 Tax=uncultured Microbacterium sp. TaxID=191216 RepID=UPI0025FBB219|nr:helix-turn-helix domain-containing protein [uncultured Microbacterium sp.]
MRHNQSVYWQQHGIITVGERKYDHHPQGELPDGRLTEQTTPDRPSSTGAASSRMAEDDYWDTLPVTLKSKDLERLLQIGQTTVSLWLNRGTIPGHQIAHSWIVFRNEVRQWLESTSTVPVPEHEPYPHPLDEYGDTLTYRELMVLLGKSRPAIFGWLNNGAIPAVRPGGKWLVEKRALHRLLDETSNQRDGFEPRSRRAPETGSIDSVEPVDVADRAVTEHPTTTDEG